MISSVIKLIRAYGGCLGIRRRRRTQITAKRLGEWLITQRSGGLRMGKPNSGNALLLKSEYIALEEITQGIETS